MSEDNSNDTSSDLGTSSDIGDATFENTSPSEESQEGDFSEADSTMAAPQGFGERFSNSFVGIIIGLILIPISCFLLFWNEGRAVRTARGLNEGLGITKTVPTDTIDPAMNGKLVHVAGETRTTTPITDADFGVSQKALKLVRIVEMYQWKESETGTGNDRKYNYTRVWADNPIDSTKFKFRSGHDNPAFPNYRGKSFGAADARIGVFPVGAEATMELSTAANLRIDGSGLAAARRTMGERTIVSDGGYFLGSNPSSPRVGNIRVTYKIAQEGPASFVGVQQPQGIFTYTATNGTKFLLASTGIKTSADLYQAAHQENRIITWILRVVGMVFLLIGFAMLFSPVTLLASYVPILGSIVSGGIFLIALIATLIVGPLVIAIAWFWYRPLLSLIIIGVGLALAYGVKMLRGQRRAMPPRPNMATAGVVRR
jgi:hypothetical protein